MINYEHIKAGIAIINEFRKELKVLCERYQAKFNEACPEDIGDIISHVAGHHIWVQISDNSPEEHYSKEEIVSDGFEFDHHYDDTTFYRREIDGVNVYACIHNEEDGTE